MAATELPAARRALAARLGVTSAALLWYVATHAGDFPEMRILPGLAAGGTLFLYGLDPLLRRIHPDSLRASAQHGIQWHLYPHCLAFVAIAAWINSGGRWFDLAATILIMIYCLVIFLDISIPATEKADALVARTIRRAGFDRRVWGYRLGVALLIAAPIVWLFPIVPASILARSPEVLATGAVIGAWCVGIAFGLATLKLLILSLQVKPGRLMPHRRRAWSRTYVR